MRTLIVLVLLWFAAASCRAELPSYLAVEAMHDDAATRIAAGQFDGLLADADKYLASRERFADGRWKLAILLGGVRRGFSQNARSPQDWAQYETALKALAARHPASADAWLFLAVLEDSHAWAERGGGYSSTVSDAGASAFHRYLSQSRDWLDGHKMAANPAWYELRISVGGALGDSPEALDRLFFEAIKREPGYQQTWFSRMMFLTPKWGGDIGDMVGFINHAARVTSPTEGRGMMARLVWIASEQGYDLTLIAPEIDWTTVKVSIDDVLRRYPDEWNAQWFFFEACKHSDKAEAQHLLSFIKSPPSPALLRQNASVYGLCLDWATGKIPAFVMRDHETGTTKTIH